VDSYFLEMTLPALCAANDEMDLCMNVIEPPIAVRSDSAPTAAPLSNFDTLTTTVDAVRQSTDATALIDALLALGKAYFDAGNTPKGLTQIEEALALAEAAGDQEAEARLWGYKGMALVRLGNLHFAQRALFRSLKLATTINHRTLQADAQAQIGQLMADRGEGTKAISYFEQALALVLEMGDQLRAMRLAGQLGALFLGMGALDKAADYYSEALHTAQQLALPRPACSYWLGLGDVMLANEEPDAAIEQYEQALNLADSLEEPQAQIPVLTSLLRAHIRAGRRSMAQLYGDQAIRIASEAGEALAEISALNLLIDFLLKEGAARRVVVYAERGLAIALAQEDWSWQLTMRTHLGAAYLAAQQWEPALVQLQGALTLAEQLQDEAAQAHLYGRIGAVLAEQARLPEAIVAAQQALTLAQTVGDPQLIGEQQILLALLYHDLGEPEQALACCHRAIANFSMGTDATLLANAEALFAELRSA
jgi:tetratricopeptide (TPR) repeat protein